MINFRIKLADVNIEVDAIYDQTRDFCRDYLTEEAPAFGVEIFQEDIDYERMKSAKEDELEGIPTRHFSDEYLETLALYRKIVVELLDYDIILFHGAAISMDDKGYLFTAVSGTGKSTHIALWQEFFGDKVTVVNGDKPLLKMTEDGVIVYGTPWMGKENFGCNTSVLLNGICLLERSKDNWIKEIEFRDGLVEIIRQSYRPRDPIAMTKTLDLISRFNNNTKLYRLGCNMEIEAAKVAYEGMKK